MSRPVVILFCFALVACHKNQPQPEEMNRDTYIYESDGFFSNTTIPIANVQIDCYTGAKDDVPNQVLFSTGYTDSAGKYSFTYDQVVKVQTGRIVMHKQGYKLKYSPGPGGISYMYPVARIHARFIKQNSYPDSVALEFDISPTQNSSVFYRLYPLANDRTITIQVPGNKTYNLGWSMHQLCSFIVCPFFGLIGGEIPNLALSKFGDTTVTIRY